MTQDITVRSILGFFLRFVILAPICLVLWWLALPYYGWLVGQLSAGILSTVVRIPIKGMAIDTQGLLNTTTLLVFDLGTSKPSFAIAQLVTNVAPFVALILATTKLGITRRMVILVAGTLILCAGHVVYIVLAFVMARTIEGSREIPTALAQLFLTLPFLLWIVFAYWDRLAAYFSTPPKRD